MARIACTVPNGITIRRSKPGYDDGTGDGVKQMVHDGPGITLNGPSSLHTGAGNTHRSDLAPGITEIDDEWWDAWLAQNGKNPLVAGEYVFAVDQYGQKVKRDERSDAAGHV